jgi:putative aldouronate transport system permease protein
MKKRYFTTLPLFLMLLPAMALLFIYNYIPMVGNLMAFERFNPVRGLFKSPWIGLANFRYVFSMPDTLQVLWNTFYIAFLKVVMGIVIPVFFALLLNEVGSVPYKRLIQTIIYFPHFLSWVILAGILIDVLSPSQGVIGRFFMFLGLNPVFFLGDSMVFPNTQVLTEIWNELGFGTIV